MEKQEMMSLLRLYKETYWESAMEKEKMKQWWKQLGHLDHTHAEEAFNFLTGKYDRPFRWMRVVDYIDSKHPKNENRKEMETWKEEVLVTDKEKRSAVTAVMADIIKNNEENKRTRKPKTNWIPRFADRSIVIWGEKEIRSQCAKMRLGTMNDTESMFADTVMKALR